VSNEHRLFHLSEGRADSALMVDGRRQANPSVVTFRGERRKSGTARRKLLAQTRLYYRLFDCRVTTAEGPTNDRSCGDNSGVEPNSVVEAACGTPLGHLERKWRIGGRAIADFEDFDSLADLIAPNLDQRDGSGEYIRRVPAYQRKGRNSLAIRQALIDGKKQRLGAGKKDSERGIFGDKLGNGGLAVGAKVRRTEKLGAPSTWAGLTKSFSHPRRFQGGRDSFTF